MVQTTIPFKDSYLIQANEIIQAGNAPEDGFPFVSGEYTGMKPEWGALAPLVSTGILHCINLFDAKFNTVWFETWINVVRNVPRQKTNRHNHVEINKKLNKPLPTYTWIYYLQLPNNLSGEEGKLEYEDETGTHKYLPNVGDLVILKGDMWHSVMPTTKSTVNRIVLAGNVSLLSNKTKRSLM